jgi:hypothetical protein
MNVQQKILGSAAAIGALGIIVWVLVVFALPAPAHAQTRVPPLPTRLAPLRVTPAPQVTPFTPQMPCIHLTPDGTPGSSFVGGRVQERCFAFPGDAGAVVSIVLKSASARLVPAMQLRGPDGNLVARSNTGQIKEQTLPLTGPYAVVVSGANLPTAVRVEASVTTTGGLTRPTTPSSNSLTTAEMGPGALCNGSLKLGQLHTDLIPFPGQECRFTFDGQRGQAVSIWMESQSAGLRPELTLLDPAGNVLESGRTVDDKTRYASAMSLPASGVYTVVAGSQGGQSAGAFELSLTEGASATCGGTLTIGMLTEVQLPGQGRPCDLTIDLPYSFSLRLNTWPLDGALPPAWMVFSPQGDVVRTSDDAYAGWDVEQTGLYTLRLSPLSRQPHRILVQVVPPKAFHIYMPSCGGVLSSGAAASSHGQTLVIAGDSCLFTFDGAVGNMIWLAVSATGSGIGFDPVAELLAPGFRPADAPEAIGDGDVFTGMSVIRNHTLARTGRYTVRVSDYGNDDTGSFFIRLWKW